MHADIEALVLSGDLFKETSRSSSVETDGIDPGWHNDEYIAQRRKECEENGIDYDSDSERRDVYKALEMQETQPHQSIGMGPGRTGVKGVIRDRNEAAQIRREKETKEVEEVRNKLESVALNGKTFLDEEREKAARGEKADELVMKEMERMDDMRAIPWHKRHGKFGHLREVGLKGFLNAIENEEKDVWVVVHLYDSSLERCYLVDEKLSRLARQFSDIKFLRARAAALGFASLSTIKSKPGFTRPVRKLPREDKEDNPYSDDDEKSDKDTDGFRDDNVDLDMLPTMLVYQNGELVYNWVRVDWEAGEAGLEEWLQSHRVLPDFNGQIQFRNPDDAYYDIEFSDDDDNDYDI